MNIRNNGILKNKANDRIAKFIIRKELNIIEGNLKLKWGKGMSHVYDQFF